MFTYSNSDHMNSNVSLKVAKDENNNDLEMVNQIMKDVGGYTHPQMPKNLKLATKTDSVMYSADISNMSKSVIVLNENEDTFSSKERNKFEMTKKSKISNFSKASSNQETESWVKSYKNQEKN